MLDYIIVGQGLAGTLLAHFLEKKGKRSLIVDPAEEGTASKVAAGIINPITGRRYVKSWRVDELIPFARATYQEIEAQLQLSFYHPRNIIRSLFNSKEENDWMLRTDDPAYSRYMLEEVELGGYEKNTNPAFSYGEVIHAAQVDLDLMTSGYRKIFSQKNQLLEERFDFSALQNQNPSIKYKDIEADKVVFCEGFGMKNNPFFNYLPLGGTKGEVLIIKIKGQPDFEKILKHRVFIVPLADDTYWIGATYDKQFGGSQPTDRGFSFLKQKLDDLLKLPYEIVTHKAAVRPTVKDRRPILGLHPHFKNLAIFNGLGTKGASLGPFWASHMADHLVQGTNLDEAININRFSEMLPANTGQ